jgi:hypothetical protein
MAGLTTYKGGGSNHTPTCGHFPGVPHASGVAWMGRDKHSRGVRTAAARGILAGCGCTSLCLNRPNFTVRQVVSPSDGLVK